MIKEIIEKHKNGLESAYIGMYEDWSPTVEEIWNDKEGFLIDRDDYRGGHTKKTHDWQPKLKEDELFVAGISGSMWATPQIELNFKDKDSKTFDVFTDDGGKKEMPRDIGAIRMMDMMLGYDTFKKRDE